MELLAGKNIAIFFFAAVILAVNIFVFYSPILRYGYATGWLDANDHTYAIKLLFIDPALSLKSIFSLTTLCDPFPKDECKLLASSTNPPTFYLIGGLVSALPIKDVNVGYATTTILLSLASIALFFILYSLTKNLLLSFLPSAAFGINIILLWGLQQGLYTALIGTLFFPLAVYFFYKSLKEQTRKNFAYLLVAITFLNLSTLYYLIPFAISAAVLILFLTLRDRTFVKNYFASFFGIFKEKKYWLLLILNLFYFIRAFFAFREAIFRGFEGTSMEVLQVAAQVNYVGSLETLFVMLPNLFYPFMVIAIVLSGYTLLKILRKKDQLELNEFSFLVLYTIGPLLVIYFPILMAKYFPSINFLTVYVADHILKSINLLTHLFLISFAFLFYFLFKKFGSSLGKQIILYIMIIGLIYLAYKSIANPINIISGENYEFGYYRTPSGKIVQVGEYGRLFATFIDRQPSLNDNKYVAMEFIRTESPQNAKILIMHPQYSFESFFLRDYELITKANTTVEELDEMGINSNYDYVLMSTEFVDLRNYFITKNYNSVYSNPEISILART